MSARIIRVRDLPDEPVEARLKFTIHQLSLVSHAPVARLEPSVRSTDEDIGGKRPPGGIDRLGDREEGFRQKSAEYFVRRARRCHTDGMLEALLVEAEEVLEAWQRTPLVAGMRPSLGDPRWKEWAANCGESVTQLVHWYGISRQYVARIRRDYAREAR